MNKRIAGLRGFVCTRLCEKWMDMKKYRFKTQKCADTVVHSLNEDYTVLFNTVDHSFNSYFMMLPLQPDSGFYQFKTSVISGSRCIQYLANVTRDVQWGSKISALFLSVILQLISLGLFASLCINDVCVCWLFGLLSRHSFIDSFMFVCVSASSAYVHTQLHAHWAFTKWRKKSLMCKLCTETRELNTTTCSGWGDTPEFFKLMYSTWISCISIG